jgi:hypothetical protein
MHIKNEKNKNEKKYHANNDNGEPLREVMVKEKKNE